MVCGQLGAPPSLTPLWRCGTNSSGLLASRCAEKAERPACGNSETAEYRNGRIQARQHTGTAEFRNGRIQAPQNTGTAEFRHRRIENGRRKMHRPFALGLDFLCIPTFLNLQFCDACTLSRQAVRPFELLAHAQRAACGCSEFWLGGILAHAQRATFLGFVPHPCLTKLQVSPIRTL